MSFSAVDNDAFEQMLDDDTDFMAVTNSPPTRPPAPKRSGVMQPSSTSSSALENQHSDLFDADIFDEGTVDDDEELPSSPDGSQAMVNYDPLSGQIVSQPMTSSSGSDEDSSGMENRNGTELQHQGGMGGDEDKTGSDGDHGAADDSGVQDFKLEQTAAESKSGVVEVTLDERSLEVEEVGGMEGALDGVLATTSNGIQLNEAEAQGARLETEEKDLEPDLHDYLFDKVPEPTGNEPAGNASEPTGNEPAGNGLQLAAVGSMKPELGPTGGDQPQSAAGDLAGTEATEPADYSKSQGAIDVPRSYESPVSSVPSRVEADSYWQGSSARKLEFPAKHPAGGAEQGSEVSSNSQPAASIHQQGEMRSRADSSKTNLEELEEMLAPGSNLAPPHRVGVSTGRERTISQQTLLPDREGSEGSPLDSGVYENEGRGVSVTPESDMTVVATSHTDGNELLIHDDHFTRPHSKDRSSSVPIFHTPPSSKAPSQGKKNSLGKTPPPRPPISPRVQKRMLKSTHSAGHVTGSVEDKVVPKLLKPLGSAKVVDSQSRPGYAYGGRVGKEEVGDVNDFSDDDELFPDDTKKVREMDALKRPISSTQSFHERVDPVFQLLNTAAPKESEATPTSSAQPEVRQESEFSLSVPFHLLFSLVLYLYYSLNIFPYIAGLFAGFLMLYLFLGSVFVHYAQKEMVEQQQEERKEAVQVSEDFVQTMKVNFSKLKEYQRKFSATLKYNAATHHHSHEMPAEVSLKDDFKFFVQVVHRDSNVSMMCEYVDIRICSVSIEPAEVVQNRKRRWSKIYPIVITRTSGPKKFKVYLFSPTAREKEDWFRRLKSASEGVTSQELIRKQREFFGYMEKYFPQGDSTVQKSSIIQSSSRVKGHSDANPSRLPSVDEMGFEHREYPSPTASRRSTPGHNEARSNQWLNSLAARLCWDIWHEKRWKDWILMKIKGALIKVETLPFMEQLCLTNIDVGSDMPMINGVNGGPRMDLRGIWVYLDVTYRGKFAMTIETKMKLGGGEEGQQMTAVMRSKDGSGLPMSSPISHSAHHTKSPRPLSHAQAAHTLADRSSMDPGEEIDSGSDEEEGNSSRQMHHPLLEEDLANSQELFSQGHTLPSAITTTDPTLPPTSSMASRGRIKSMVTKVAKKVVNTKFVRRAAEKVSNYSLVLTVEVNKLDGILAVNIPPPPSDTIWWGFHGSPKLELVAKPKVGHREVKLSRVTHWIEKKLCDIVDKKLVLPEMEYLVVPILNSGMAEDKFNLLKPISSDSDPVTPTR